MINTSFVYGIEAVDLSERVASDIIAHYEKNNSLILYQDNFDSDEFTDKVVKQLYVLEDEKEPLMIDIAHLEDFIDDETSSLDTYKYIYVLNEHQIDSDDFQVLLKRIKRDYASKSVTFYGHLYDLDSDGSHDVYSNTFELMGYADYTEEVFIKCSYTDCHNDADYTIYIDHEPYGVCSEHYANHSN